MTDKELKAQIDSELNQAIAELHLTDVYKKSGPGSTYNNTHTGKAELHVNNAKAVAKLIVGSTPAVPPATSSMPVGDIPGWKQVFSDDFTVDVPLGQFPEAVASKWFAQPYPWKSSAQPWATYDPHRTLSVHDGVLDMWIHTVGVEHLVGGPLPRIAGPNAYVPNAVPPIFPAGLTYARTAIRFKSDRIPTYKIAWLMWPDSNIWPRDGEIDFPEGNLDGTKTGAYLHWMNGTGGFDAYEPSVAIGDGQWHTAIMEWLPSRCTFILDDLKIGESTNTVHIPNTKMHWSLQADGQPGVQPDSNAQGHILIDWVAVWTPV